MFVLHILFENNTLLIEYRMRRSTLVCLLGVKYIVSLGKIAAPGFAVGRQQFPPGDNVTLNFLNEINHSVYL